MAVLALVLLAAVLFLWGHYIGYWQGVEDADKYPPGSPTRKKRSP